MYFSIDFNRKHITGKGKRERCLYLIVENTRSNLPTGVVAIIIYYLIVDLRTILLYGGGGDIRINVSIPFLYY